MAFIEKVNSKNIEGVVAEPVRIDKVIQGAADEYAVIVDRISQDVPFYRAYLKNAAICGTAVINNPFWWSADEKFFNNCLAVQKLVCLFPKQLYCLHAKFLLTLPTNRSVTWPTLSTGKEYSIM